MARATLHDVAAKAGVSIKTVSRVVNNEPNVRPGTRDAVLKAIKALDYRPDTSARRLAGRRSYLVGLLYEDPSPYENPSANYVIDIQGGVLERVRAESYDLLIHPCNYQSARIVREIKSLVAQTRVDGLILAPPLAEMAKIVAALRELGTPFVRISPGQRTRSHEAVHTNDRAACADMTRYLASLGHKRIAFIVGHPDHRAVANRYLGYKDGLESSGLTLDKSLVQQGYNTFESGEKSARVLLLQPDPPTAIFASNDDMAAGVLRVAHEMGIAIPAELSVAGFDDVPLARQIWPSLTTIRQPTKEMAAAAAELLFARIKGDDGAGPIVVEAPLVLRESTGPRAVPQKKRKRQRSADRVPA